MNEQELDNSVEEIKKEVVIAKHTTDEAKIALNKSIVYLLHKERFFGNFILNMRKHFGNMVPTAGVNITDQINLYINPDFFCSLSLKHQVIILKHECYHLMNWHMVRSAEMGVDTRLHKTWNIACDLEINEAIPEVTEFGGMYVDDFKKEFPGLLNRETAEYYYAKIREWQKENPGAGEGMETLDDHGIWEEGQGNGQVTKELIKNTMKKAVEQSGGIGSCPGDVALALNELNKASVNWKKEMRQFFVRTLQYNYELTRKKRNRRTGILNPGKKKKPNLNIVVAVDTSGSMSNEALKQVFSEIKEIHAAGAIVTIVEADSQVQQVYAFDPKKDIEIKGRGGTAYQPVFDYVNTNLPDIDAMIFAGDMDAFDVPNKPKYPVLWAVNGNQNPPGDFGKVIRVIVEGEDGN